MLEDKMPEIKSSWKRTTVKMFSYRTLCSAETFVVTWIITGEPLIAGTASVILFFVKLATYFVFERVWANIHWGRYEQKDS
jgi:uncharacterized membrane protein